MFLVYPNLFLSLLHHNLLATLKNQNHTVTGTSKEVKYIYQQIIKYNFTNIYFSPLYQSCNSLLPLPDG